MERAIGERTLVAHNAAFDMGVLRATLAHYDVWCEKMQFVCSVALARRCWPELPRHSLDALAREFGIGFRHHNAEEDAMAAAKVVLRAAEEYSRGVRGRADGAHPIPAGRGLAGRLSLLPPHGEKTQAPQAGL